MCRLFARLFEGTTHFVVIHLRWLGKCLKRILQKRLHDIIIFFVRWFFFVSTHISHCCMIKSADIDFPLVHFQVWRLQAALGEQSEITKCTKQEYERLQNVWPLPVSALSFHLKYAVSAFSSFFHLKYIGTICPLTSELFGFKLSTLKDLMQCNLVSDYIILVELLTL